PVTDTPPKISPPGAAPIPEPVPDPPYMFGVGEPPKPREEQENLSFMQLLFGSYKKYLIGGIAAVVLIIAIAVIGNSIGPIGSKTIDFTYPRSVSISDFGFTDNLMDRASNGEQQGYYDISGIWEICIGGQFEKNGPYEQRVYWLEFTLPDSWKNDVRNFKDVRVQAVMVHVGTADQTGTWTDIENGEVISLSGKYDPNSVINTLELKDSNKAKYSISAIMDYKGSINAIGQYKPDQKISYLEGVVQLRRP
ncbi:MAG: hypothetical protein IK096_06895, partial [Lachnospiraceae bacterium]|nr:hypothetical protein [Lachnospiraceae bacterium]